MKNQVLFSSKDKRKKIKMSSAAIFVWCFKLRLYEVNAAAMTTINTGTVQ